MIRILQISDIHFLSCEDEEDKYSQLRQRLLDDVDDLVDMRSDIDVILVCGDIANKGQKDEYKKAREFFKDLAEHCHCSLDHIFLVPGNHDVNWDSHKTSRELLRKELFDEKTNNDILTKWRKEEPLAMLLAHSPFENYREMALIFDSNDELAQAIIDGESDLSNKKFYWKKHIGEEGGFKINIVGMNTALISGNGDYVPEKASGQKMFLPTYSYNLTRMKNEVNISMMHHPMSHVLRGGIVERSLDSRFQIQLYGHTHKQSSVVKDVIKIYSGALQPDEVEGDEYVPIYNMFELHIDETDNGKRLVVDLYSRQGNDSGFVPYKKVKETLSVSLKHENQWAKTVSQGDCAGNASQNVTNVATTMKRTVNELNYLFLMTGNAKGIMQKLNDGFYNKRLSDRTNRLRFLQWIRKEDKYEDLDKLIP